MPVLQSTRDKKRFYKQTFAVKQDGQASDIIRHTLLINPEDLSFHEPAKVTATETLGGGYISDFGSAFKLVTITGITGYGAKYNAEGQLRDGFTEFTNLRNNVYRNFIKAQNPKYSMYWYNWEDDDYWRVQPTSFRLMRNKNEPTLYRYELQLTLLEEINGSTIKKPKFGVNDLMRLNLVQTRDNLQASISSMSEVANKF